MLGMAKQLVRSSPNHLFIKFTFVRYYKGGIPGCNLPSRKLIDNPTWFTAFYLLVGIIGFGAPRLVIMHPMLRPYEFDD